jgi:RHS repeat-associated protein
MRIRDQRTGANAHDRRYAYTTGGALLSAYGTANGKVDVVYANGEAIAEIDGSGNIYELHNDHLGGPRYITDGNASQQTTGQINGEQAFGPYGEQMAGTFNGKQLPSGYRPLTGYTGHLNEDLTGLVYMKGRYYSPRWHRFINSDQGVDPNSLNQFAYVGGRPFMAKDPSGMLWECFYVSTTFYSRLPGGTWEETYTTERELLFCVELVSYTTGGGGGMGGFGPQDASQEKKTDCEEYVDRFVEKASFYHKNYPLTGILRFGWDLFSASNNAMSASFSTTIPGYSGFKEQLVNNEQGHGVYKHISGVVGSGLIIAPAALISGQMVLGLASYAPALFQTARDFKQYVSDNSRLQSFTEIRDNIAGMKLIPGVKMYFLGSLDSQSLNNYMVSILCDKKK